MTTSLRNDGTLAVLSASAPCAANMFVKCATLDLRMSVNRSLSPATAQKVVGVFAAVLGITALRFWLLGAWPVALFCLLDAAVFACLLAGFLHRAPDSETLVITDGTIRHTRLRNGQAASIDLPAYWTRLDVEEDACGGPYLWLVSHGERHALASCLSPAERTEIAPLVRQALRP